VVLSKVIQPLKISAYKISWSHADWCTFCIHLRSLTVHHFGVVEATGKKNYCVEVTFKDMTSLNFIKICQLLQKLIGWTDTDRQEGDLISLLVLSFRKESWLKILVNCSTG
jgi:hypothetical protein